MSIAYYNEIDPYVAAWLRNLIEAGHIAPGYVDERSIEDVRPYDLRGFTQCHFFAGIGVWSSALRRAGWPDDRRVWTASCPCQPFSAAGQGAGFADERHLWPHLYHLIEQCRPAIVLGEQVASKDANAWLDLVHTDLEAVGYAFGAVAFPSAGVGAPHIRDRTYWVADANDTRSQGRGGVLERTVECAAGPRGVAIGMADTTDPRQLRRRAGEACDGRDAARLESQRLRDALGMADTQCLTGRCEAESTNHIGAKADGPADRPSGRGGAFGGLGYPHHHAQPPQRSVRGGPHAPRERGAADRSAGPTNGLWRDADWLFCRDGKWRPVESGTFPLAHGAAARVGRLRAYGNAVNAEAARVWIEAVMECLPG